MGEWTGLSRPYEQIYPISDDNAFNVVNLGVWYALSRIFPPGHQIPRDHVAGGTLYHLNFDGQIVQLFILRISEHMAEIRIHLLIPLDPIERTVWTLQMSRGSISERIEEGIARLLLRCDIEISELLHRSVLAEGRAPPPPQKLEHLDRWRELYHREKTTKQTLAVIEEIDGRRISAQTLHNIRSQRIKAGHATSSKRGRPKNR